ncbi:hypothetical protein BD309DRAFT_967573, partial [Dichomitus squalens]
MYVGLTALRHRCPMRTSLVTASGARLRERAGLPNEACRSRRRGRRSGRAQAHLLFRWLLGETSNTTMENDVAGLRWGMARRRQTPPGDDCARTAGRGGFLSLVGRLRSGLRSVLSARQGDHLISLSKWLQRRERHCIVGPAPSSHPRATEHRRYLHCTQLYQYQYTYSNIAEPFECHITPRLEITSTQLFCQAPLCCVAIPYVVDSDGSR